MQVATSSALVLDLRENLEIEYGEVTIHPTVDSYIGLMIDRSKDLTKFNITQRGLTDKILAEHLPAKSSSTRTRTLIPASDKLFSCEKHVRDEPVDGQEEIPESDHVTYVPGQTN